jgi:hypothetical protein
MILNVVWAFVLFNYLPSKPTEIITTEQHQIQDNETQEERKRTFSKEITPPKNTMNARNRHVLPILPAVNEYIGMINILKKVPKILLVIIIFH